MGTFMGTPPATSNDESDGEGSGTQKPVVSGITVLLTK
jgi:hypothetical protein